MRRHVIRDRATADPSAWFGNLAMHGAFAGCMAYLVARYGLPDLSGLPWWLIVGFLLLAALALPTFLAAGAGIVMLVVRIPSLWRGEVAFRMGPRGLRMPEPVPWSEVVAIEVGPVGARPATAYPDPGPAWGPRFAVTVAIGAHAPAQTRAYARSAAAIRRPAEPGAHDRWQARWSAVPQRVGFHAVVPDAPDLDAIRAVARRYAPHVPVRTVPRVPLAALEVPHRTVAAGRAVE